MQGELRTSGGTRSFRAAEQAPTIATKLAPPPTPAHLVVRERLLDRLDAAARGPLVLLCAPPGAGKTILLASWLATRRAVGPLAWLSLDQDDNDASRLAADLLDALRTAGVIRRGSALHRLAPPRGARADVFLAMLVNGLARLRGPFLIVLDDLHELSSPQAIGMLDFLVRHTPNQCHLLLASRADPPIPIQRLRISGALSELRGADLAFDRQETGELYRQMDLSLRETDVDTLWRRTEGWAAALRLAGLSAQAHRRPHEFVAQFAGTERAVADYLVAEVLTHAPAQRRAFMLRTSIADSLCPELSDALTGMEDGAITLAALERSGAPVQLTAADGPWYRYHPLFRELLRAHLRHTHPEEVPLLHRRAARWYAEHEHVRSAIRHSLAGESFEQAGSLIEEHWLELFISGASVSMRAQMSSLPAEAVAANPRLAVAFAGARLEDGDVQGAERYLSLAQSAVSAHTDARLALSFSAVTLLHARLRGDAAQAQRSANELAALAGAPGQAGWLRRRSFAQANLGATLLWNEDLDLAQASLQGALEMARECGCEHLELDCRASLALAQWLGGRLWQADQAALQGLAQAERCGLDESPAAACAYLAAGSAAYWRGEMERAEGLAGKAVRAAQAAAPCVRLACRALQAAALAAGGPRSAREATATLDALSAALRDLAPAPAFLLAFLQDTQARALLAAGEIQAAESLLDTSRSHPLGHAALHVRQAEAELLGGQPELARRILAQTQDASLGQSASLQPPSATQIEAWLLLALIEEAGGERPAAAKALERALELAEEEQICGPFLMRGDALRALLERQAERGTEHPAMLEVLLDGIGQRSHATSASAALAEPLTERELQLLRYLPTMLRNAEIGAETFVSLNTVKTHLRSIYRKLEVTNRADAVERARTLGLLPRGIRRQQTIRRG